VMDCLDASPSKEQKMANLWGAESAETVHGVELACLENLEPTDLVPLVDLAEKVDPRL
jgi:hypothetical protein